MKLVYFDVLCKHYWKIMLNICEQLIFMCKAIKVSSPRKQGIVCINSSPFRYFWLIPHLGTQLLCTWPVMLINCSSFHPSLDMTMSNESFLFGTSCCHSWDRDLLHFLVFSIYTGQEQYICICYIFNGKEYSHTLTFFSM